jgi:uncharacterized protein YdeI (BOF family)
MKKVLLSSLLVVALSGMAMAQTKQPGKTTQPSTSKTTTQSSTSKTATQPSSTTVTQNKTVHKSSTAMTRPKHRRMHKAKNASSK